MQPIPQSPFNITVKQAARFDASKSRIISSSMTIVTAVTPATFKIDLKDKFNSRWHAKNACLTELFDGKASFHYVSDISNPSTDVEGEEGISITHTSSGSFLMEVKQTIGEGLLGTYFFDDFGTKIFSSINKI